MLRRGLTGPAGRQGPVWPVTLDALVALAMPPSVTSYVRWRGRPVTIARHARVQVLEVLGDLLSGLPPRYEFGRSSREAEGGRWSW